MIEILAGLKLLEILVAVQTVGIAALVGWAWSGYFKGPKGDKGDKGDKGERAIVSPPAPPQDIWHVYEHDKRLGSVRKDSDAWKNAVATNKILKHPATGEIFRG